MSPLLRFFAPILTPCVALFRKISAKRKAAAGNSLAVTPTAKFHNETLSQLGAASLDRPGWQKTYDAAVRKLIQSEALSGAHVTDWLNSTGTQPALHRMANARIAGVPFSPDDHVMVADSYMLASGDHRARADDLVELVVNVLQAGVRGAIKDDGVSAQLQAISESLHLQIAALPQLFEARFLPEAGWTLDIASDANADWLKSAFSDRGKAKLRFGQALCPADESASLNVRSRTDLTKALSLLLNGNSAGDVVAVTGDEGNGKSWLVAQTWLDFERKPLTLFLTAEDVAEQFVDPISLLSRKLCDQTGRQGSDAHKTFWLKLLGEWKQSRQGPSQGFLVVIDGLNQRPSADWARKIDRLCDELRNFGGGMVLTSRKRYFDRMVKFRLVSACHELEVPEWTVQERDTLLSSRAVQVRLLRPLVSASLCNPRLLSVALTLLDGAQLESLEELSIPLLLFEHLRISQDDTYDQSVVEFKRSLQDHANTVLHRLNAQQRDDLNVFEGGLDAVAEGRFFVPLSDDLSRYTVSEDGLTLALGMAILDELRKAKRNHRDLDEALSKIVEPIEALDQTANAILAALTLACADHENSSDLGVSILLGFASLQNLEEGGFPAVAALARVRPLIFVAAMHTLALQGRVAVNFDWIEAALLAAKRDSQAWEMMAPAVMDWLSHLTLDVEKDVLAYGSSTEEAAARRLALQEKLANRQLQLSEVERDLFLTLRVTPAPDVSILSHVALKLLAGTPLKPFAQSLIAWSFASFLNGNHNTPGRDFQHLIQFNSVDWMATRGELLQQIQRLRDSSPSLVGTKTLISILRATGHPADAQAADELMASAITKPQSYKNWSRRERYCSTDPRDPSLAMPDIVEETARKYAEIDATSLYTDMAMGVPDLFFNEARPAVARYFPKVGVRSHRALIDDLLRRDGTSLQQGVLGMLEHSSLITHEQAIRLSCKIGHSERDGSVSATVEDGMYIWHLFQLELAFPLLNAGDQLDTLLRLRYGGHLSNQLIRLIKPLGEKVFEANLARSIDDEDTEAQFFILLFTPFNNRPLSSRTREHMGALLSSSSTLVRAFALKMLAGSDDTNALAAILHRGWVPNVGPSWEDKLERWYASEVIIEAAAKGIAAWEPLATQIHQQHLGVFSVRLGGPAARYVASVLDTLIKRSLSLTVDFGDLDIEVRQHATHDRIPQSVALRHVEVLPVSFDQAFERHLENSENFDRKQRALQDAFVRLQEKLASKNADSVLDQFSSEDFKAIVATSPALTMEWCRLLISDAAGTDLCAVSNLALVLAQEVATTDPLLAVRLFEKFTAVRPLVRVVFGHAGIELGAMSIWAAAESTEINSLRARRLDQAENNYELAREVWTGLWKGKSEQIQQYIDARLDSVWPVAQARAILVAGLMQKNSRTDAILKRFNGVPGLLGDTQRLSLVSYERHAWAMHWYGIMRAAKSAEDFWQAAVLFLVTADGRVEALFVNDVAEAPFQLYWPGVERQLKNRFDKLRDRSKKRMFADEAPATVFFGAAAT